MKSNKHFFLALAMLVSTTAFSSNVFADESIKLSEEKRGNISQNCGSIRQSLKLLQRSDSRARTYFGAIYETVSSRYITPLNLRLIKNNISSIPLVNLQTSLAETRTDFSFDFIDYSRSLEDLIATDCRLEPDLFYERLQKTREKRKLVARDMKLINDSIVGSVKSVEKLKENLDED